VSEAMREFQLILGQMMGQLLSSDAAFDWKIVRDYHSRLRAVADQLSIPQQPAKDEAVGFFKSSGCVFCDLECCTGEHPCTVELDQVISDLERLGREDGWLCASVGANLLRRLSAKPEQGSV